MWHNPAHMTAGHAAAAKSRKTPKHLKPHLKGLSMKTVQGKPITGAATQMKATPITGQAGSMQQAASQIKASPMPFQNPKGAVKLPAPAGPTDATGDGKSINRGGLPNSKPGKSINAGPVGGGKPKHRTPPSGMSRFYGTR